MKFFSKIHPYFFPRNPLDMSFWGRFQLGLINYAGVNSWWTIGILRRWIIKKTFIFRCLVNGQKKTFSVSGGDQTHLWAANEVLLDKVYDLSLVSFVPDLIYDFGANIGMFSIIAATKWPSATLICLEPHPRTFYQLMTNIRLNHIAGSLLQCAVDSTPGIKFLENEGAIFQKLCKNKTDTPTLCIKMDSLIDFSTEQRLLIKMDIEGSETSVLNAISKNLPFECFIFIELHQGEESISWITDWAVQHGFHFFEVRRRGCAIDGYLQR